MTFCRWIGLLAIVGLVSCSNGPNSKYEDFGDRINTEGFGHKFAQPDDVDELVLGPRDSVNIEVANIPEASSAQVINANGAIEMYFVGQVKIAGLTPSEAENKIRILITPFVKSPTVRVLPISQNSQKIYFFTRDVDGTLRGGSTPYQGDTTLVDLMIEVFDGAPAFADDCNIKVLRADPRHPQQWIINFRDIVVNGYSAANIQMKPDDIVWLPQNTFARIQSALFTVTRPLRVLSQTLRSADDYRFLAEEGEFRSQRGRR
ncbi:MAG: polysaccharide biosynthesis/export family protein [Planctomycetota bacterium]